MTGGPTAAWMDERIPGARKLYPDALISPIAGFGWSYRTEKRMEVKATLLNERRGARTGIAYTDINGSVIDRGKLQFQWDHIALPLSFGFRSAGRVQASVALGVVPSYAYNVQFRMPPIGPMTEAAVQDVTDASSEWTVGLSAEVGGAYALNDRIGLLITGRYYHGMTPVEFGISEWSQRSASILLGLEYTLDKGKATE